MTPHLVASAAERRALSPPEFASLRASMPRYLEPEALVRRLKWCALQGSYDGTHRTAAYLARCRAMHLPLAGIGAVVIWTRDDGMHASGWWKNPHYARCMHLSLSFFDVFSLELATQDRARADAWVDLFHGDARRHLWAEPPYSEDGKRRDIWHYRVFADAGWQPMTPKGEVYTRAFTECGWRSWSDLHGDDATILDPKEQP